MNIGNNIRNYRSALGLTQAQLGMLVGVSAGAVSKWENGASVPDLQLIMPLARALGVSTDCLLSYEAALSDERVSEIHEELKNAFLREGYERGVALGDSYIRQYPNSLSLKLGVANLMQMYLYLVPETEHRTQYVRIKDLLEAVTKSGDLEYSGIAGFSLAMACLQLEEYEQCEEILNSLSKRNLDPSAIWLMLLDKQGRDADAELLCKQTLLESSSKVTMTLSVLARLSKKDDADRAIFYIDALDSIEQALRPLLPHASSQRTHFLLKKGDKAGAAKSYLRYVSTVVTAPYDYRGHPFFCGLELSGKEDAQRAVRSAMYKDMLDNPGILAELCDEPDYIHAAELLREAIKD